MIKAIEEYKKAIKIKPPKNTFISQTLGMHTER